MTIHRSNMSFGCLVVFLLPFFLVGIGSAFMVVVRLLDQNWQEAGFLAVFALTFGGMASLFLFLALKGKRAEKERERLVSLHPNEPWLWKSEWASANIESATRGPMLFAIVFAVFWNTIAIPVPIFAWDEIAQESNKAAYLVFLFPAVGIFLIIWAVRQIIAYLKFGVSKLQLESVPGVIGRGIMGEVVLNTRIDPREGFRSRLVCVRRVRTGSGKNRRTAESIVWQEERIIKNANRDYKETKVPIAFPIDADLPESDDSNPSDSLIWRLELSADVPGVDYSANFEVPVFRTDESDTPLSKEERKGFGVPEEDVKYRPPTNSKIEVNRKIRGAEVYFPPARNPGTAFGLSVFLLIWIGVVCQLVYLGAPILFPIVFGAFAVLIAIGVFQMWFGITRLELSKETIKVTSGLIFAPRVRQLNADVVSDVKYRVGMQSGNTPYYKIVIEGRDGTNVVAGRGIKNKREVEWLVKTIKDEIGF